MPCSPVSRACARANDVVGPGHARRLRDARQVAERRSHDGRLAGFGLDQNVRSDQVTPTEPSGNYSTAITVMGHPGRGPGRRQGVDARVPLGGEFSPSPIRRAGRGARCPAPSPRLPGSGRPASQLDPTVASGQWRQSHGPPRAGSQLGTSPGGHHDGHAAPVVAVRHRGEPWPPAAETMCLPGHKGWKDRRADRLTAARQGQDCSLSASV